METNETQRGERTCPESPTVLLIDMGLKLMASSSKSTVEKEGQEEGQKEGRKDRRKTRENPCLVQLCIRLNLTASKSFTPAHESLSWPLRGVGGTKLENWVLARALEHDLEQKPLPLRFSKEV